ncbi:Contains similarity to Chlamydia outer membrane protein (gb/X53512) [Arabidopsis thaliana]|uniref:T1G11.9 protein n=1 Tax=Arabidopsis thaliana TaxID=3702 RepID=O23019_ARATH|nr:Contains similarity to Chlamydia outer membrane protein (gb/X53512) [Arabidopsis thaliana]
MEKNAMKLLEEIKSSDLIENRAQLLTRLSQLDVEENSDLPSFVESLTTLWEDFTCLDVSLCLLNKAILPVASKYLALDRPDCSHYFLAFAIKLMVSKGLSYSINVMQLLLDYLRFSASSFTAIGKTCFMTDDASAVTVHKFVSEQLNLTKELIMNSKAVQVVIDSTVRLCKEYSQTVNREVSEMKTSGHVGKARMEEGNAVGNLVSMITLGVKSLSELGMLAARDGGNLVAILNTSWKGEIILKLISLIKDSLRFAAEAWSCSVKENISATEARRVFLPVKFYLINAVKVVALFPSQASMVSKDIALCILMISAFKVSLSQQTHGKSASEVMTDLLEKTTVDLLGALLNAAELTQEFRLTLLDSLFVDEFSNQICKKQSHDSHTKTSLVDILSLSVESATSARDLLLARVVLFQSVMRYSFELDKDAKLAITTKLQWLLDILADKEVYSSVLSSQLPMADGSGKIVIWESMYSALLLSLKTLMIILSSTPAWEELETFLLQNLLHPHFLCWQIVMELWCFWVRHATDDLVVDMINQLCTFIMSMPSSETPLCPDSVLRRTTKSICFLLTHSPKSLTVQVYKHISTESRSDHAPDVYLALLLDGFPLNFLPDRIKNDAKRQIFADFFNFIEKFDEKPSNSSRYTLLGAPVFTVSACLRILKMSISEIDAKTLNFVVALIQKYRNSKDETTKERYSEILSETLSIISRSEQLYTCQEMDNVITELQKLFNSETNHHHNHLRKSKPNLALFLSGLSKYEMSETKKCPKSIAVWELYHMLLRKRHWALVHHAVTAFGYFCARTSCNQLWRFVPEDAALAFDIASGKEAKTERFMSELKMFLEKEQALLSITPSEEELELLSKEGTEVKATVQKLLEGRSQRSMEVEKRPNKKRKLPEGICRGMELLQNGVKRINEGLNELRSDENESEEFQKSLSNQFSCLEDLVSHLLSLTAASD